MAKRRTQVEQMEQCCEDVTALVRRVRGADAQMAVLTMALIDVAAGIGMSPGGLVLAFNASVMQHAESIEDESETVQ